MNITDIAVVNRVEIKKTGHPCNCHDCRKRILKGEVRVRIETHWFHAQCFVDIVESIPEIETLWKNSIMKNVTARLKGEDE